MKNQTQIRPAAVAGMFYPGAAEELKTMVDDFVEKGAGESWAFPKAMVAPHAGYLYSGPIAGSSFKPWRVARDQIKRVILLGPSHYVRFSGLALSRFASWSSPLGEVTADVEAMEKILELPYVKYEESAHEQEHCLEVELPFLQRILTEFKIVPVVTGEISDDCVAEVLDRLWGGPETGIVISSDLSHFYDYAAACRLDRATADAVEELEPAAIHPHQACGRLALQGLLQVAKQKKLEPATVDLRNSGDTAGRKDRVVGYGSFIFRDRPPGG